MKLFLYILSIMPDAFLRLLKLDRDRLRRSYISRHNKKVLRRLKNNGGSMAGKNLLVLLPHCLQNSDCLYKITWDKLDNCRRCGKCCIPLFLDLRKEYNMAINVVTGGTAAREIIKKQRPDIIIAVACENDLVSGVRDVGDDIPVVAVLNERPKGPCRDTTVDVELIRKHIDGIFQAK